MPWFHGLISRKEAEELLAPRYIGCFLVRVSENRFGYTLSYRVSDRCRHYMVEQDTHGRYALVGVPKVCSSLNELIEWFSRNRINDDGDMLREPCGQAVGCFLFLEASAGPCFLLSAFCFLLSAISSPCSRAPFFRAPL